MEHLDNIRNSLLIHQGEKIAFLFSQISAGHIPEVIQMTNPDPPVSLYFQDEETLVLVPILLFLYPCPQETTV